MTSFIEQTGGACNTLCRYLEINNNNLLGKPECKRPVHGHRPGWETCTEIELESVLHREVDWIRLAQDKAICWVFVSIVHGLRGTTKSEEFLDWLRRYRLLKKWSGFDVCP